MMYRYIHGGEIQPYLEQFSIDVGKIVDFSVNINPLGAPDIVANNWLKLFKDVEKYPTSTACGVLDFYNRRFGIDKENVVAANGSIELFYLAYKALNIKKVAIVEPSFYDYKRASEINGCRIFSIVLKEKNNFEFVLDRESLGIIEKSDAVIFANPNNPTGKMVNKERILELIKRYKDKWFLIDEAFIQFSNEFKDKSFMFCGLDNVVIFHSLTKFYALAGLRIGAAIGKKEVIDRFKDIIHPWCVNRVAENVTRLLINCKDYEKKSLDFINTEKKRIYECLKGCNGIKLFKTDANFFLAKWFGSDNLDDLLKYLLEKGMFVRDCRNFYGLSGNFFRFAILKKYQNSKLIDALCEL